MKILISAYAFKPESSSEPWIGWSIANELLKNNEITVVTRKKNQKLIDSYIKENKIKIKMIYFDLPILFKIKKLLGNTVGALFYYYFWQLGLIFRLKINIKNNQYDYIHHLTYINSWLPSFLPLITNRFIWGPIAEHPSVELKFLNEIPKKYLFIDTAKRILKYFFSHFDPFYYYCIYKSKYIIVSNENIAKKFHKYGAKVKDKVIVLSAIHYEEQEVECNYEHNIKSNHTTSLVMAGRWAYWKGFINVIDIFEYYYTSINSNSTLTIITDDDTVKNLEQLIKAKHLEEKVIFVRSIDRISFMNKLATFDVFLYPNFGINPIVLIDANTAKVPVICFEIEGTHELIDSDCNIKIPTNGVYSDVVRRFALSIDKAKSIDRNKIKVRDELKIDTKIQKINNIYNTGSL